MVIVCISRLILAFYGSGARSSQIFSGITLAVMTVVDDGSVGWM